MNRWILGARPRTLPAAIVPVAVGSAIAVHEIGSGVDWWRIMLAAVVALALQIGANYANDYSDGVKGTDHVRVGPVRLVASGLASPFEVRRAAFIAFIVAGGAGTVLSIVTSPWILLIGGLAVLAAWFYTGGSKPYGYYGLGELAVFIFFGVVATTGTTYVLIERIPSLSLMLSIPVGFLACALLVINNLRDIPTDTKAGKNTLAVKIGDTRTRLLYVALFIVSGMILLLAAFLYKIPGLSASAIGPLLLCIPLQITVLKGAKGKELIPVLGATARVQILTGLLLAVTLVVS